MSVFWLHLEIVFGLTYVLFGVTPNFLLTRRNRYSEGTDDGQMIPHGYPNFSSSVKYLRIWYSGQTDGQRYRWMDRDINPGGD